MAAPGILAPLQDQRLPARNGKGQTREYTRRAEAHDHGPFSRIGNIFRRFVVRNWGNGGFFAAALLQCPLLISVNQNVDGVNDLHIRLFPRVHAAADNAQLADLRHGDMKQLGRLILKLMCVVLRRELDIP